MYARIVNGTPFVTHATFERARIRVIANPNSHASFLVKYRYRMPDDVEIEDELRFLNPATTNVQATRIMLKIHDEIAEEISKSEVCSILRDQVDERTS